MKDLDKHHLKDGAWLTEPLQNPRNDFVSPLMKSYLIDLDDRITFNARDRRHMASAIRKTVKLNSIHDLIQETYVDVVAI
jgi:hypothetical protein